MCVLVRTKICGECVNRNTRVVVDVVHGSELYRKMLAEYTLKVRIFRSTPIRLELKINWNA